MRGVVVFNKDKRNVCSKWCALVSTEVFFSARVVICDTFVVFDEY